MYLAKKTCLVLDDDPDLSLVVTKILENSGVEVYCCENMNDAIGQLAEIAPHFVMLDLMMPGENGFVFLSQVKKLGINIPIFVLSADGRPETVKKAVASGAADFILKPIDAKSILQKLNKYFFDNKESIYFLRMDEKSPAKAYFEGEILRLSDAGCQIASPLKMESKSEIKLRGNIFKEVGLEHADVEGVVDRVSRSFVQKWHRCNLQFKLLTSRDEQKIRSKSVRWK